ncbi:3011_t:CDS:1, partial [Entrophospora sp. SA101]
MKPKQFGMNLRTYFDERRRKNGYSYTKMYDMLSKEIRLSTGTLSGFYAIKENH